MNNPKPDQNHGHGARQGQNTKDQKLHQTKRARQSEARQGHTQNTLPDQKKKSLFRLNKQILKNLELDNYCRD